MKRFIPTVIVIAAVSIALGFWLWRHKTAPPAETDLPVKVEDKISKTDESNLPKEVRNRLRFSPENNQTLAYEFSGESESQLDSGFLMSRAIPGFSGRTVGLQEETIRMKLSGKLLLKYFTDTSGFRNVAARISGLSYQVDNAVPAYAESAEFPFAFQMDERGFLSHFQFVKGISSPAKEIMRHILYSMQTGFPEEYKTEWITRETDVVGQYRSRYSIDADKSDEHAYAVKKEKQEYLTTKSVGGGLDQQPFVYDVKIVSGDADIRVPKKGAWIENVHFQEETVSSSRGREWAKSRASFSARRIEKDMAKEFPDTFSDFLSQMSEGKYRRAKYYATEPELSRIGAGLNLEAAIEQYFIINKSGIINADRQAEKFLVNYLREHPEAASELVNLMDADTKMEMFDDSTQLILWRLITEAGHPEAQQAVIEAAVNPKYSMSTHMRAVAYIHDFESPEPFLVDKLWELHRKIPENSADSDERQLKSMALFAIGSLGYAEKQNDELKPEIGRQLADYLKSAETPDQRNTALSAIGNYGGSDIIEEVIPYFSDPDENVRAAACKALRRSEDPKAADILMQTYAGETSAKVKEMTVRTLSDLPVTSKKSMGWAAEQVVLMENPKEQEPLVRMLGKNLKEHPENEQVLRNLLKTDPDTRIKQEVYKYIVPKKLDVN